MFKRGIESGLFVRFQRMGLDAERLTVRAGRGYGNVRFARFLSKKCI